MSQRQDWIVGVPSNNQRLRHRRVGKCYSFSAHAVSRSSIAALLNIGSAECPISRVINCTHVHIARVRVCMKRPCVDVKQHNSCSACCVAKIWLPWHIVMCPRKCPNRCMSGCTTHGTQSSSSPVCATLSVHPIPRWESRESCTPCMRQNRNGCHKVQLL